MTIVDILSKVIACLAGSMLLAAAAGIALGHESKISERDRLIDGYASGGTLTLLARFREGWPKADRQLRWLFMGSFVTCPIAFVVWIVSQMFR